MNNKWIRASERLPDVKSDKTIFAARCMAGEGDVLYYDELLLMTNSKIRVGEDVFNSWDAFLVNIEWLDETEEHPVESNDMLSNLAKSTENLSKIKNKDEWLNEVRGKEAEFQTNVDRWLLKCFGEEIARDKTERNHRFLEEALELVQSLDCTKSEAHQLVDYVFNRPIGEPYQECGGVMVTLAALCLASDLDMERCGQTELDRIWTKVDKIREKQANKPKHSPLPQKEEPISEDELIEKFKPYVNEWENTPKESLSNRLAIRLAGSDLVKAKKCAQIAQQYSDSKLSELEKWVDENNIKSDPSANNNYHVLNTKELKTKIQSLK